MARPSSPSAPPPTSPSSKPPVPTVRMGGASGRGPAPMGAGVRLQRPMGHPRRRDCRRDRRRSDARHAGGHDVGPSPRRRSAAPSRLRAAGKLGALLARQSEVYARDEGLTELGPSHGGCRTTCSILVTIPSAAPWRSAGRGQPSRQGCSGRCCTERSCASLPPTADGVPASSSISMGRTSPGPGSRPWWQRRRRGPDTRSVVETAGRMVRRVGRTGRPGVWHKDPPASPGRSGGVNLG